MGSKGNRYKLVIDDPELSEYVKKEISDSVEAHKKKHVPLLKPQDFMRNKRIEVRLI